jgi:hypothetical protein
MRYVCLLACIAACNNDLGIHSAPPVPPAPPPGTDGTTDGQPPDWNSCYQGWRGVYYNLRVTDKYVDPRPKDPPAPDTPDGFPYWTQPEAFENPDVSLDFGQNWWPVNDGLADDPKYFAVHWDAWVKSEGGDFKFMLGSQDDSWVYITRGNDKILVAGKPGIQPFERDVFDYDLDPGQYPIDIWFIQRGSETSGFSFRSLSGDVKFCYPDFGTPTD